MKIILNEAVDKVYLKRFNISSDKVIHSIQNPDSKKIINFQTNQVIYIIKKFDNYYLLIDCRNETAGEDEVKIDSVFMIDEQLVQSISIENTLAVLEVFANEFGYQLEIGDYKGKFIQNAKIKIPYNHSSIKKKILYNTLITDDDGRLINGTILLSLVADSKDIEQNEHIHIFFFYCISLNKYMYYLKTNNFM